MELNQEQKLALEKISQGGNFFVNGAGGTGKSHLLKALRDFPDVAFVAQTASAALLINGTTVHKFFRLPVLPVLTPENIMPIKEQWIRRSIQAVHTLVIDEVGTLRSDVFAAIDYRLRQYPDIPSNSLKPFGGRQIVLCGDFYQLGLVVKDDEIDGMSVQEYLTKNLGGVYAFSTSLWQQARFRSITLTENMRQIDPKIQAAMNAVRVADCRNLADALKLLNTRVTTDIPDSVVRLCTSRAQAKSFNDKCYRKLKTEERVFHAHITGDFYKDLPNESELKLKVGEHVIITANLSNDVVNGTTGTIEGFEDDYIRVKLDRSKVDEVVHVPLHTSRRYVFKSVYDEVKERNILRACVAGEIVQYPLIAGYAITIHRSQGMTIPQIAPVLDHCFAPGQAYVALSRCRDLDGLYLSNPIKAEDVYAASEVIQADFLIHSDLERFIKAFRTVIKGMLNEQERMEITASRTNAMAVETMILQEYEKPETNAEIESDPLLRFYGEKLFQHALKLKLERSFDGMQLMLIFSDYLSAEFGRSKKAC